MELLTFDELSEMTGLSKYRLRYYRSIGYFDRIHGMLLVDPKERDRCYDSRWAVVWQEALHYGEAGFDEWDALKWAKRDVFAEHCG